MSAPRPTPRPARRPEVPVVLTPGSRLSWESFSMSAFRGLAGLLLLLTIVLGVVTESWSAALGTAKISLVVLLVLSVWLYVLWFVRQRRALARREETEERGAGASLHNFRPR